MIEVWLFENPWPAGGMFALVALVLAIAGWQRADLKLGRASVIAVACALGVFLLDATVQTPTESLRDQAGDLVSATEAPKAPDLLSYFDPAARLVGPDGELWLQGPEFLTDIDRALDQWRVQRNYVRSLDASLGGSEGVTTFRVMTLLGNQQTGDRLVGTLWRLRWRKGSDGRWRVIEVQWLELARRKPMFGIWR